MSTNVEQLKKLIADSPLLSEAEKSEWLKSLEFMNDKQLEDLHEILNQSVKVSDSKPEPIVPLKPATAQISGTPLEDFLSKASAASIQPAPVPKQDTQPAVKVNPKFTEWKNNVEYQVHEKELPKGEDEQLLEAGIEEEALPEPVLPQQNSLSMSALLDITAPKSLPVEAVAPVLAEEIRDSEEAEDLPVVPEKTVAKISSLNDAASVGVAALSSLGFSEVVKQLRSLATSEGYFNVLFNFEQSPLYKAYVETGKKILDEHSSFEGLEVNNQSLVRYLSKTEFERVADILREMKS